MRRVKMVVVYRRLWIFFGSFLNPEIRKKIFSLLKMFHGVDFSEMKISRDRGFLGKFNLFIEKQNLFLS